MTSDITVHIPAGIVDAKKLFNAYDEQLLLPGYFGWNWDAFDECLRTLEWIDAESIRSIGILHDEVPFRNDDTLLEIYMDILLGAIDASIAVKGPELHIGFSVDDAQRARGALSFLHAESMRKRRAPYSADAFMFDDPNHFDGAGVLTITVSRRLHGRDEVLQCFYDRIPMPMELERNWSGIMEWIRDVNYRVAEPIRIVHDSYLSSVTLV